MLAGYARVSTLDQNPELRRQAEAMLRDTRGYTLVVWFNFAPDRVHWANCAGRNFTDRQRYEALPAGERLAVQAAISGLLAEHDRLKVPPERIQRMVETLCFAA